MGEKYILALIAACLVVLFITALIAAANSPKFKPLISNLLSFLIKTYYKPFIKQAIVKVENWAKDENLEKAGVKKMASVVAEVKQKLPPSISQLITDEIIERICQSVYDGIQDNLIRLCEKARTKND